MARFHNNDYRLLIATTVIEVGLDVPNATLMVIENPERLGLAQLHQLRGRIGRGREKSHCILLYSGELSDAGRARLKVIRESQDGFHIAEQDLKLRGPGEILGTPADGGYPVSRRQPEPPRPPVGRRHARRKAVAQGSSGRCRGVVTRLGAGGHRAYRGLADFDHLEVFLADAALGAHEVFRNIFPPCTGCNVLPLRTPRPRRRSIRIRCIATFSLGPRVSYSRKGR